MNAPRLALTATLVTVALAVPARAEADIIAAFDAPVGAPAVGSSAVGQQVDQFDIALVDAATGVRQSLPAAINTSADELHPSITPDGKLLAFERVDPGAGTTRIITASLATGQQADLFDAFEVTLHKQATPFIEPDGGAVLTGQGFAFAAPSRPRWTQTSLAGFPAGPFTSTTLEGSLTVPPGETRNPVDRPPSTFASEMHDDATGTDRLLVRTRTATGESEGGSLGLEPGGLGFGHPALSAPGPQQVVVAEKRARGSCRCTIARLGFMPVSVTADPIDLPQIVNAPGLDEAFPAFTPDGRYLGFVRQTASNDDRLFVFDTVTQTLLNGQGVDLGVLHAPASARDQLRRLQGSLSLRQTFVLAPGFQVSVAGNLSLKLLKPSGVGILVQRIVGHHRLLGHVVRKLKTVGRVPLGHYRRGRHRLHWNLRVNGRRLRAGAYLVTPRSVTGAGVVRDLGTPRVLRVR